MTLTYKTPTGAQPGQAHSPSRIRDKTDFEGPIAPNSSSHSSEPNAPMLSASSTNISHLSLKRNGETCSSNQSTGSFDFLPSVSFDDLHTSIESASTDFKITQFASPTGEGSILEPQSSIEEKLPIERPAMPQNTTSTRGNIPHPPATTTTRVGRSGSILRRPSTSSRQASVSSILSSSGPVDAPTAPAAMRSRRQSHYPPVSNTVAPKAPRKSVGPGIITDSDIVARNAHARRASLLGDKGGSGDSLRRSTDSANSDSTRALPISTSRAAKAKSVQPPARMSQGNLLGGSDLTPEQNRLSTLAPRSPRIGGKGGTPSSGKRMSMMPGSHATGLGARTISPTDTRRMKRLSTMPQSQSLNMLANVPPPPPPISLDIRAESRSPSLIPRKASLTPSSSRTTPDIANRKSYSSGLSTGSTASFNTVRSSTGSIQPRLQPSSSATRLPAPKNSGTHNNSQGDEDEDVPPVPAIPKAYESPKEVSADAYFVDMKKFHFNAVDSTSVHSNSTGSMTMPVHPEPTKAQQRSNIRKSSYAGTTTTEREKSKQSRKQLEPLRLPPLNIGPLNFPTAPKTNGKLATSIQRDLSPPPSRQLPKTPTTPMTASKSFFFSKSQYNDTIELPSLRSSTSIHHIRRITPTPPDGNSSESSSSLLEPVPKSSISPFLSSSLPKGGFEAGHLKRVKTGGDYSTITGNFFDDSINEKPAGPRDVNKFKPVIKSPPPEPQEPEALEPRSPSSKTSLRRKLSLSWRRDKSKDSGDTADKIGNAGAPALPQPKADAMPPPRIPASASAAVGSFAAAKHAQANSSVNQASNGISFDSRRRKSSVAGLTNHGIRDRVKSETWNGQKDSLDSATMPSARSVSGVAGKDVRPKTSSSVLQTVGSWTTELDKDDRGAEEEMRKLGSRRKETEIAGKALDALKKRATPKECVSPQDAIRIAMLNIYERGEIIDYNDIYFCGTQNARKVVGNLQSDAPNFGYDDERGDYTIVPGDHLSYRYEIVDVLGKGSFGQVVRCIDHKLGVLVAVKIIRNKKRFHQQALVEVNILQKLREWDPKNKHSMVNFTQSFYFRGHLCISTELLDMNLYEFIKAHSFRGFSLKIIRRFTKQILASLVLLKQRKVIHCDLKPENILLKHPLHSEIKVIDFGSSCFEHEKVYTYIQSRFYRSPEVILGMTYGMPIDMWSVGCILAELYTGVPIFPGENEQEQLACIMEVFGPPEKHLIEKSTRKKLFFDSMGKPRLTVSSKGRRRRPSSKTLQQVLKCDDETFLDFVARCLRWDPERRLRPEEAVRHEFITGQKAPIAIPRLSARDSSPSKRANPLTTPRPLPEPPNAVTKSAVNPMRTGMSPHKPVSGASRRTSGATAATAASINRRTSAGGSISSISSLPRAAGRTVSGKQDLAAAGASAAMGRRA